MGDKHIACLQRGLYACWLFCACIFSKFIKSSVCFGLCD